MERWDKLFIPGNSLLVVGNGFDVGLHLPTKYTDFMKNFLEYRCYIKQLPNPQNVNDDGNEESQLYTKVYNLFKERMDKWKKQYESVTLDNGTTFDNTIFKNLLILILIFKYNYKELFRVKGIDLTIEQPFEFLNEQYYRATPITGDEINWFNLEDILAEISDKKKYVSIINSINKVAGNSRVLELLEIKNRTDHDKDYNELKNGLLFLKSCLSIYLQCVEEVYFSSISQQINDYFQKILNDLEFRQNINVREYSEIISLNYTHSAEKLFKIPTKYPHGQISTSDPVNSSIVLGYYNSTEENNFDISFIDFQKYYQRILLGTGTYETGDKTIKYIDFYGFSCDPADTELINILLTDHKKINRIRVFCYKDRGQNIVNMVKSIGRKLVLELTNQHKLIFEIIE